MFSFSNRLYAITDTRLSGLSHAQQVAQLCDGGAQLIQLREKQYAPRIFYEAAMEAATAARDRGASLIINDRVDIALAVAADGVHLGQDDLNPEAARRILGPDAIIGLSTHNVAQARAGAGLPISYIAIGPIFPTSTKRDPEPAVGLEGLRRVREVIGNLPLVAIGGITTENAAPVVAAGADAVAIVGALFAGAHSSISANTKRFLQVL